MGISDKESSTTAVAGKSTCIQSMGGAKLGSTDFCRLPTIYDLSSSGHPGVITATHPARPDSPLTTLP
jgi:hypothetical protein